MSATEQAHLQGSASLTPMGHSIDTSQSQVIDIMPHDLILDQNGRIYIAERLSVTCLENDGTFKWRAGKNASISNYGSSGTGNGEFNYAYGITLGNDGNLYVADKSNQRIQILDKNGSFLKIRQQWNSTRPV